MKKAYRFKSDMMKECVSCCEYCNSGYILHTLQNRLESKLFVCDECYHARYASAYILSEVSPSSDQHISRKTSKVAYPVKKTADREKLFNFMRKWNGWAKRLRYVSAVLALVLTMSIGVQEKPDQKEIQYQFHQVGNQLHLVGNQVHQVDNQLKQAGDKLHQVENKLQQVREREATSRFRLKDVEQEWISPLKDKIKDLSINHGKEQFFTADKSK